MLAEPLAAFTQLLLKAQTAALEKLAALLETADDPREVRRIATALLKLKPPQPPAPTTTDAASAPSTRPAEPHHAAPEPLLPAELDDLRRLFPDIHAAHFTSTHSPTYWRGIIFRHAKPDSVRLTRASVRAPSPESRAAAP